MGERGIRSRLKELQPLDGFRSCLAAGDLPERKVRGSRVANGLARGLPSIHAAALTAGGGAMGVARPALAPREIAASLGAALLPENDVRSAWLFGSTAAGRARQDSDVDVGVWMDGDCTFERFADLAACIEGRTGRPIDLLVLDRASPLVVLDAVHGIPVLTRDERAQLEWVLQVSREAEDWGEFLGSFLLERRRHREAFPR